MPLVYFLSLARIPGVQLYSLQKGTGSDQLRALAPGSGILDLADRLHERAGAFTDTAAAMMNLDLVITSDTSIAHLAGGLGVPVWVVLNFSSDWRWLLERQDSPWYPTMRLFRQQRLGDWGDVFARLAAELGAAARRWRIERLQAPLSIAELIDRITVLMVQSERMAMPEQRQDVRSELATLVNILDRTVPPIHDLAQLTAELRAANEIIVDTEEALRQCEKHQEFGPTFVELARRISQTRVSVRRTPCRSGREAVMARTRHHPTKGTAGTSDSSLVGWDGATMEGAKLR